MHTTRYEELRQVLTESRARMESEVRGRIRVGRSDREQGVTDELERSDADTQEAIDLALLQMRTATLLRIKEALSRLDAGAYGECFECNRRIPVGRLRAMPFAVRCLACEDKREVEQGRVRHTEMRRAAPFASLTGLST